MDQLAAFLEIEKKYDLCQKTIEGEYIWVYSRFPVWRDEIRKAQYGLDGGNANHKDKTLKQNVEQVLSLLKYSLFYAGCKKHDVDILILGHERRILKEEEYICKYTDFISKTIKNHVVLERPYEGKHYSPTKGCHMLYNDRCIVLSNLYAKVMKIFKMPYYEKVYKQVYTLLSEPLNDMAMAYQAKVNVEHIVDKITTDLLVCQKKRKYYTKLLKQLAPKVIVETVSYSKDHMIINEIAKDMGVCTIELQHGAISSWHCAYRYSVQHPVKALPDKMLIFGEYWRDFIQWPIAKDDVIATGFPFFEESIKEYQKNKVNKKIKLLFLSQRTIGKQLGAFARECARYLDESKYQIVYKLHPSEYVDWKERYDFGDMLSRIEVIDNGNRDLYEYFAESDVQIGVYSTSIYEGLGFDLPTCIYRMEGSFTMDKLCDVGLAEAITTPKELEEYILKMQNRNMDSTYFWSKRAKDKIINLLFSTKS